MADTPPILVLLVDDDERDYLVTRGHLMEIAEQSYVIDWARGGDEGLQRIAENRHDVVLLDQQLGRMSGQAADPAGQRRAGFQRFAGGPRHHRAPNQSRRTVRLFP